MDYDLVLNLSIWVCLLQNNKVNMEREGRRLEE